MHNRNGLPQYSSHQIILLWPTGCKPLCSGSDTLYAKPMARNALQPCTCMMASGSGSAARHLMQHWRVVTASGLPASQMVRRLMPPMSGIQHFTAQPKGCPLHHPVMRNGGHPGGVSPAIHWWAGAHL